MSYDRLNSPVSPGDSYRNDYPNGTPFDDPPTNYGAPVENVSVHMSHMNLNAKPKPKAEQEGKSAVPSNNPSSLATRRKSQENLHYLQAPEVKEPERNSRSVGWEPVSPGILDESPEVLDTLKKQQDGYYNNWTQAPAAQQPTPKKESKPPTPAHNRQQSSSKPAASSAASSAAASSASSSSSQPAAAGGAAAQHSKAAELGLPVIGLEGGMLDMTNAEFRGLLKSAINACDLRTTRALVTNAIPKSVGVIKCCVKRHKEGFMHSLFPTYECFLEEASNPLLVMSSKKRTKNRTSNYTISLLSTEMLDQAGTNSAAASTYRDPNYLGKLRSNFTGSEFTGYDAGVNPEKTLLQSQKGPIAWMKSKAGGSKPPSVDLQDVRQELCHIMYDRTILSRTPRRFTCVVPAMLKEEPTKRIVCRPLVPSDSLHYQFEQWNVSESKDKPKLNREALEYSEIVVLQNKPPVFEASVQAYCLNFHGRATVASVKNFQLINAEGNQHTNPVLLQFGKVDKDVFTLDVQYPLSMLQAFQVALAGLDAKLVCD